VLSVLVTIDAAELNLTSVSSVTAALTQWLTNATSGVATTSTEVLVSQTVLVYVSLPTVSANDARESIRAAAEAVACSGLEVVCAVSLTGMARRQMRMLSEAGPLTLSVARTFSAAAAADLPIAANLPNLAVQGVQGVQAGALVDGATLGAISAELRMEQQGNAAESVALINDVLGGSDGAALSNGLATTLGIEPAAVVVAVTRVFFPPSPPSPPPSPPALPPSSPTAPPSFPPPPSAPPPWTPPPLAPLANAGGLDKDLPWILVCVGVGLALLILSGVIFVRWYTSLRRKSRGARLEVFKDVLRLERKLSSAEVQRLAAEQAEQSEGLRTGNEAQAEEDQVEQPGPSSSRGASSQHTVPRTEYAAPHLEPEALTRSRPRKSSWTNLTASSKQHSTTADEHDGKKLTAQAARLKLKSSPSIAALKRSPSKDIFVHLATAVPPPPPTPSVAPTSWEQRGTFHRPLGGKGVARATVGPSTAAYRSQAALRPLGPYAPTLPPLDPSAPTALPVFQPLGGGKAVVPGTAGPSSLVKGAHPCSVNIDGSVRPSKAPAILLNKMRVDFDGRVSPRHSTASPGFPDE